MSSQAFDDCDHEYSMSTDKSSLLVCKLCGGEKEDFDFNPEWNYYSAGKDPSRCHRTSQRQNTIAGVFKERGLSIPQSVLESVESRFKQISKNSMTRSQGRKGIIAACLFHTYLDMGEYRTTEYICKLLEIDMKSMSVGMSRYSETFQPARLQFIKPEDLLKRQMDLVGIGDEHFERINNLTTALTSKSVLLKRSAPQSVAAAMIYFYLCLNKEYKESLGITKQNFADRVAPSAITITKLVNEAMDKLDVKFVD